MLINYEKRKSRNNGKEIVENLLKTIEEKINIGGYKITPKGINLPPTNETITKKKFKTNNNILGLLSSPLSFSRKTTGLFI